MATIKNQIAGRRTPGTEVRRHVDQQRILCQIDVGCRPHAEVLLAAVALLSIEAMKEVYESPVRCRAERG